MPETAITIAPTTNTELATMFDSLHAGLLQAAERSVDAQGGDYTAMERKALVAVEALRLLNGWDLAGLLERGKLINMIEQDGLVGVFPGDYHTLEQLAQAVNISATEVSDTRTLCNVIFPWIEANLPNGVAYYWDLIGKSKFRELVPVLCALIHDEPNTGRDSVAQNIAHLMDEVQASAATSGEGLLDHDTLRNRTIEQVLEYGHLPTQEMRRHVRVNRTPNVPGVRIVRQHDSYVVLHVTSEDQQRMIDRLLGHHVDINNLNADEVRQLNSALERLRL